MCSPFISICALPLPGLLLFAWGPWAFAFSCLASVVPATLGNCWVSEKSARVAEGALPRPPPHRDILGRLHPLTEPASLLRSVCVCRGGGITIIPSSKGCHEDEYVKLARAQLVHKYELRIGCCVASRECQPVCTGTSPLSQDSVCRRNLKSSLTSAVWEPP